jgi:hypothetical protein
MKKVQSVLCALALAISLSSTVFAGNIHADKTVNANGILISDLFTWSDLTGMFVSIFGVVLAD